MPVKTAGLPFNIFVATVSGSASAGQATFTSSVTAIQYKDNVGYQVNLSGNPIGILQVNASNDYTPLLPQGGGAFNSSANGNWLTLASLSISTGFPSPIGFDLNQVPFAYIQCQFISGTSSGTLTGWVSTKGL